jgi:Transposase IS4
MSVLKGFTGRASDTVNIPTKPVPIGFKIWVLADQGYVFDFLWHVKGGKKDQGTQGLQATWEEKGFSKTQAVVLELMTRMPNGGKGHKVHLDNLFTLKLNQLLI